MKYKNRYRKKQQNRFRGKLISRVPVLVSKQEKQFFGQMQNFKNRKGIPTEPKVGHRLRNNQAMYSNLDQQSLEYYFHWREQFKNDVFLPVDEVYVRIFASEVINRIGWKDSRDAYRYLRNLTLGYDFGSSSIQAYLLSWLLDFAVEYNMTDNLVEDEEELILRYVNCSNNNLKNIIGTSFLPNLFITAHLNDRPLNVSYSLLVVLAGKFYPLEKSRIIKENPEVFASAYPRAVALVDAIFRKNYGHGLLEHFSKEDKFAGWALYDTLLLPRSKGFELEGSFYEAYNNNRLSEYLGDIARQTENALRKVYQIRGRIKVRNLDQKTKDMITAFIEKEYTPKAKKEEEPPKSEESKVILNSKLLDKTRLDSDKVREALEIEEESTIEPIQQISEIKNTESGETEKQQHSAVFNADVLPDEFKELFDNMDEYKIQAIKAVLKQENTEDQLTQLANEACTMPELLLNDINDLAINYLDDLLIDIFEEPPLVFEEYSELLLNSLI